MKNNRLQEITQLANTALPSVGAVPNAPELLKLVNIAIRELIEASHSHDMPEADRLLDQLRYLRQEAQNTIDFVYFLTQEDDETGDRPYRA